MPRTKPSRRNRRLAAFAVAATLAAVPASADWLMTTDGTAIETRGPWKVQGRTVVFTDTRGTLAAIRLNTVDLEASEAVTAGGGPVAAAPEAKADENPRKPVLERTNADIRQADHNRPAAELALPPKVVMYSTSWCGYCRRARKLLNELEVDFVEKDIEKSSEARSEYTRKGGRGVPLFDFDGTIVRGYKADVIREQATRFQTEDQEDG